MRIRIHRGTEEIGGTCIEVESEGRRIVLDVGLPLDALDDEHDKLLPDVSGFRNADDGLLAVLFSHPHLDHFGLAKLIRPEVPVYIGRDAHNILTAASRYVPNGQAFANPRFLRHETPVQIGPFKVTPYLVDHSAFDAYSLLIEADGKRVFYTGDFRAHGRKAALFERLVRNPPRNIDVLLMEGTTIGRSGSDKGFSTEKQLEERFVEAFRNTKGLHFVWTSIQNIDRIVTIFRAAKKTGRTLIINLYAAVILEATGRDSIPKADWDDVKVYIAYWESRRIKEEKLFDDLGRQKPNRVYKEDLPDLRERAVMLFSPGMMRDFGVQNVLEGARFTYSMWRGYLKEERCRRVMQWLKDHDIPWQYIHTSGHASVADLQRFAAALAPRKLVPIHTFEGDRYPELFNNVTRHHDGTWWQV